MADRYEIMPLGTAEQEAAAQPGPLVLTVTCSPRHGLDHTVDVAERVAALGHRAVVHLAARAVRDAAHLDALLGRIAAAGMDDVFVIAGDGAAPAGPYASAVDLLPVVAAHRDRPARLGVGAYPEGHPLIAPALLDDALRAKAPHADYLVTQLCFDPAALSRWLGETRAAGLELPVYVGVPGAVDRRRLLEISLRVGVGASVAYLRKQRGVRRLLGRGADAATELHDAFAPLVGADESGVAGLHYFTFNNLAATVAWDARRRAASGRQEVRDGI